MNGRTVSVQEITEHDPCRKVWRHFGWRNAVLPAIIVVSVRRNFLAAHPRLGFRGGDDDL